MRPAAITSIASIACAALIAPLQAQAPLSLFHGLEGGFHLNLPHLQPHSLFNTLAPQPPQRATPAPVPAPLHLPMPVAQVHPGRDARMVLAPLPSSDAMPTVSGAQPWVNPLFKPSPLQRRLPPD